MTRPLRVLVSAYACDPYRGSEDGVGCGWLQAIAARHDVHVITAAFQREALERRRRERPAEFERLTFHHVRPRWFHYRPTRAWRFVESTVLKPAMNLVYAQWLRDAARLAAELDVEHDFDLVHVLTYVGYRFPGRCDRLGKPLVWGPIGGLENTRWRFLLAVQDNLGDAPPEADGDADGTAVRPALLTAHRISGGIAVSF